ncbi:hypothetical protein [sulfur-oxidizing endosymbiont of Gigantopelta aegis]|uniref:hypothetical protein n=1 Tax=sulfur-oxidizing endosymbiont of Gigantopelta aegis TaxID=2794934 RepID=UPI0018DC8E00|nr:hypothetical protein [sulfur-oxidizing endosymbiont of Gigantopelta aegis]
MPRSGTCKCLHCHTFFKPNPRSKGRQKFCSAPECRQASKAASQKKWLQKPQNKNYFCGTVNVQRVQQWRSQNPKYWKIVQQSLDNPLPLQDTLITQAIDIKEKTDDLNANALQEILKSQPTVLIGLIAHLIGSTLQDDIVESGLKLRELGEDLLLNTHLKHGENNDRASYAQSRAITSNPLSVQLDRSPPGS